MTMASAQMTPFFVKNASPRTRIRMTWRVMKSSTSMVLLCFAFGI